MGSSIQINVKLILLVILIITIPDLSTAQKNQLRDKPQSHVIHPIIHAYIKSLVDTSDFQGTVLIAKGNKIIHRTAYGMFDREHKIPNQIDTKYLLGSLTKSFVSIAIMQLQEQGLIDLYAPINKYIPKLKSELADSLNIHLLLKQQSGLVRNLDSLSRYEIVDITPDELLVLINKSRRVFSPGSKHEISSLNFMLLGMIIENVSGKSYQEFLYENIFSPAGIRNTGMERLSNVPEKRAMGYRRINGKVRRIENVLSYSYATADMYSTVDDLFKWGRALQTDALVSIKSKELLFDGGIKEFGNYGYGFRTQSYLRPKEIAEPGKLIRHGGVMSGFAANYHYYREDDLTIIILNNFRNLPILDITFKLKELAFSIGLDERKNKFKE